MEDTDFDQSMNKCEIPDLSLNLTDELSFLGTISQFCVEKVQDGSTLTEMSEKKEKDHDVRDYVFPCRMSYQAHLNRDTETNSYVL